MSGIFEQIAVLSEGVMRASQLSEKQQDAKKDDKAAGIDWNMNSIINSELIEHTSIMLHRFESDISGIELPQRFTYPFCYKPHALCVVAASEVRRYLDSRGEWRGELALGKMMGVLVVSDASGRMGFLAAFSGLLAGSNRHRWFVPPIYDLLNPEGHFRHEEACISGINRRICDILSSRELSQAQERLQSLKAAAAAAVDAHKAVMARAKAGRDALREAGDVDTEALTRESQWQKAELRRIKASWSEQIASAERDAAEITGRADALKRERAERSAALQRWLFDQYVVLNANGESRSLSDIFAETPQHVPPGGAGECAAPKLLQYAYLNGLKPLAMAEFWCGKSPSGEVRRDGSFYPACHAKCLPILSYMMQGLDVEPNPLEQTILATTCDIEILLNDEFLVAVNKPAGMLTVPGKVAAVSLYGRVRELFPDADGPIVVHRLDQDTSGVVVFAKDKATHKALQRQWATRGVRKRYIALLDGQPAAAEGTINLPLCLDAQHRPQQMVSREHGKAAVTRYRVLGSEVVEGQAVTRVELSPLTGRTHQLRVHAAHRDGLNAPILGDRLYGSALNPATRLYLHAQSVTFTHPATGRLLTVTSPLPF